MSHPPLFLLFSPPPPPLPSPPPPPTPPPPPALCPPTPPTPTPLLLLLLLHQKTDQREERAVRVSVSMPRDGRWGQSVPASASLLRRTPLCVHGRVGPQLVHLVHKLHGVSGVTVILIVDQVRTWQHAVRVSIRSKLHESLSRRL